MQWFGPIIQHTAEEDALQAEERRKAKERSVHSYREPLAGTPTKSNNGKARPSLMHRLSSAVELSSYWRASPTTQQQQPSTPTKVEKQERERGLEETTHEIGQDSPFDEDRSMQPPAQQDTDVSVQRK